MLLLLSFVNISDGHSVALDDSRDMVVRLHSVTLATPLALRTCTRFAFLIEARPFYCRVLLRGEAAIWTEALRRVGAAFGSLWRTLPRAVVDLEVPEEEDILVVLHEHHFKHKAVKLTVSLFVLLVLDGIRLHALDDVQRDRGDGPSQVADRVVVILVVTQ